MFLTCIVALRTPKEIIFGADSLVKIDSEIFTIKQKKVWKRGNHLWGVAGSPRLLNILNYDSDIPSQTFEDETGNKIHIPDDQFANITMMDSLRLAFREAGFMETIEGKEQIDSKLLFTVNNHVYYVGQSLSLVELKENYISIGAGAPYALSSLYTTEKGRMSPVNRVKVALETAEKFSPLVSRPFEVISIPIAEEEE